MGNVWTKLRLWLKTTLYGVIFVYALLFIINNSGEEVHFWWWFGHDELHGKLTFGFTCFLAGVGITLLLRTTLGTLSQLRDMQAKSRSQKLERDVQEMKEKAAKLQTRTATAGASASGAFEVPDPDKGQTSR
jgi:hypothetical protein